ncbi:MAG: hypothetical protein MHM6MM_004399 [Cercozoa sp. M6MM]
MHVETSDKLFSRAARIRRLLRHACFFVFGLIPWLLVNGVFQELAIFAQKSQKSYGIAAPMALWIALGNIGPFLHALIADINGGTVPGWLSAKRTILAVLALSTATALGFVFGDIEKQSEKGNDTPLLALCFIGGLGGCLSLVSFYPFVYEYAQTDNGWSTSLMSAGTSVGNLAVVILGISQQAGLEYGQEPRFSVSTYFWCVTALCLLSSLAFALVLVLPLTAEERAVSETSSSLSEYVSFDLWFDEAVSSDVCRNEADLESEQQAGVVERPSFWRSFWHIASHSNYRRFVFVQFWINLLAMFLPGTAPLAVQRLKGNENGSILHWMIVSQLLAQTFGIIMTGFRTFRCRERLLHLTVIATGLWFAMLGFIVDNKRITTKSRAMPILMVNGGYQLLYGFISTAVWIAVAERILPQHKGEHVTRVVGTVNQIGAFVGALAAYFLTRDGTLQ